MYTYYTTYKSKLRNIWIAAKEGSLSEVIYFVEEMKEDVNKEDDKNNTPLYYACLCGHYDVAEYLIKKGSDDKFARSYWNSLTLDVFFIFKFLKVERIVK
jgi:ankyrin repeat protein